MLQPAKDALAGPSDFPGIDIPAKKRKCAGKQSRRGLRKLKIKIFYSAEAHETDLKKIKKVLKNL